MQEFIAKMKQENLDDIVIDTFLHYYEQAVNGETGLIYDNDIQPVDLDEIQELGNLDIYEEQGKNAYKNAVRIVLNGGLGTSMGLTGPKSLLKVKDDQSFLNVIMKQAENSDVSLLFMNSFSTHDDTISALDRMNSPLEPKSFCQNKYPKVLQGSFTPASWPSNPKLEWNPPATAMCIRLFTPPECCKTFWLQILNTPLFLIQIIWVPEWMPPCWVILPRRKPLL